MADDVPASCKVVTAAIVAQSLRKEVLEGLEKLARAPLLVGFLANDDSAARKYAEWTDRTCQEYGIQFELREADREDIESRIVAANHDDHIDGIIVYYPIFGGRRDQYLQQITAPRKDVEGLCHYYIFKLYHNERFLNDTQTQKSLLPCTPLAVIKILDYLKVYNNILPYGNRLFGRSVTVINRSETVGRPLAALLANDGACVFSVDLDGVQQFTRGKAIKKKQHEVVEKDGWNLDNCLPFSDVVISAVPGEKFKVPTNLLRDGAVCINVSTDKNFDVDVKEKASIYVPAIGKVTIVILFRNLLRLIQNRES